MIRHRLLATKCLAIDTSAVNSIPCSIWYAACSTISLHWYSSTAESAMSHWIALLLGEQRTVRVPLERRATIMSRAISAWPIQRMQCASRAGPSRYWPSR